MHALILALGFASTLGQVPARDRDPGDLHLLMGNPSKARADKQNPDPTNYLIVKDQFALSYNSKRGTPNWVSYHLRRQDMGRAPRSMDFFPDDELPRAFYAVRPFDYHFNRTGFSRGHMCPNGHRNNTEFNARSTFVMTNMVPQTEELNDGAWKDLEIYCRDLAFDRNREMFIVCGPHGVGGTSERGTFKTIGDGRVTVPKSCWKVVMVLDARSNKPPLERVDRNTRILAVLMPNDRTPENKRWTDYAVTTEQLEQLTGLLFFDRVPANILGPLKKMTHRSADLGVRSPTAIAIGGQP